MNINRNRQIEREKSGRVRDNSLKELWKFEVNEANSGRAFQVKYIYICIKFLLYEISLWQLKFMSTVCVFVMKIRLLNNYN